MNSRKITLFLKSGLPKGIRSATIDQWSGRVISGPRNKLSETIDFFESIGGGSCIYFLVGESEEGGLPLVYVGESDKIALRIKQHDSGKDWWDDAVIFFTPDKSLTTTGSKFLEALCLDGLKSSGKCIVQNSVSPARDVPYEDVAGLQYFYENIALLLPLLGYDVLIGKDQKEKAVGRELFYINRKGIDAKAFLRDDGQMQVLKGSTAVLEETPSFEKHPYKKLRDDLIEVGKLMKSEKCYKFVDDYVFSSLSAAAAVILGNSANGKLEWKINNQ